MTRSEVEATLDAMHGDGECDGENSHEHCETILKNDAEQRRAIEVATQLLREAQRRHFHEPDSDARAYCTGCAYKAGQPYRDRHRPDCLVTQIEAFLRSQP